MSVPARLRSIAVRCLTVVLPVALVVAVAGSVPQHELEISSVATTTICTTMNLSSEPLSVVRPRMTAPICYDGKKVWQNGSVTAGVNTFGYTLNGITWAGTYNSGGSTIGIGMNYSVTIYSGWLTLSCASRWIVDAHGVIRSYERGC